jgi:hypothetical protein
MPLNKKHIREALDEIDRLYYSIAVVTGRLREELRLEAAADHREAGKLGDLPPVRARLKRSIFDRHECGQVVAYSLAPEFDSTEFARAFKQKVPEEYLPVFDAARMKKILITLCTEGHIFLVRGGGGRRPALYRIKTKPRRKRL